MAYSAETFTDAEREILSHYVTNLDGPVFALVNLPEVVKGALFARYSRSSKSLRRLFLDEFVGDLDVSGDETVDATVGLRRAEELYARVFGDYGDDSVAQLGGVHLACEKASNVLTKILERGRLMSYLEQSTRYIPYDNRLPSGHYRYYRDPEILESPLGARYVGEMDRMFDVYGELMPRLTDFLRRAVPKAPDVSDVAYRQSVRARALDALRGLLPAGALSNLGIYGSGQSYEMLVLRLRAHPLPEARKYAEMVLTELRKVIPSFLTRLDRPERGGEWSTYFERRAGEMAELGHLIFPGESEGEESPPRTPSVRLSAFDPRGEDRVLEAMLYPYVNKSDAAIASRVARMSADERDVVMRTYVGDRKNRRHRPGRAFERTDYRFDIVSDYGAFRDLQRHRMLTVEWQPLTAELGYEVPEFIVESGLEHAYVSSLERSRELYEALAERFTDQASYAVALAYQMRYSIQMNAREAMHLLELRSGPQGHPSYRKIAQEMHRAIADEAGHHAIAQAMSFVDYSDVDLGRLDAERRAERRMQENGVIGSTSA
jgi:thymidylate synthase ThyX